MNEILIFFLTALSSMYFFVSSFNMPAEVRSYPQVLLVIIFSFSVILIYRAWKKAKVANEKLAFVLPQKTKKLLLGALFFIIYISALQYLGYIISTALFFIVWQYFIVKSRLINNLLISIGCTTFSYVVFGVFLKVPLPTLTLF